MASAKNMTVAQRLKALYNLQSIDTQLDSIHVLKGELPIEVQDLEDEIHGLEMRIKRLEDDVKDIEGGIAKHTNTIKESEMLILKYEKQQDNVRNDREYDALTKEIELQKLDIQLANKRIKEAKIQIQNKDLTLQASNSKLENKKKDLELKKEELNKIIKNTEKEEEKLQKKREKAEKKIEARLLKNYNRVRGSSKNGLAVVTIERNSCGGCFNKIPLQLQTEIAKRKVIIPCEHCGRILVDDDIMNAD
jgi:predicted  nucleic acid-binding Zn-ribbon protein